MLASIEKKKKKAAAKNMTVAVESKKRKGQVCPKAMSKRLRTVADPAAPVSSPATSYAAASASAEEDSADNTGRYHDASIGEEAPGDLVVGGSGGAEATVASMEDPFLSVLGGDSSPNASWAPKLGGRSPILEVEVLRRARIALWRRCRKMRGTHLMLHGLQCL